MSAAEVPGDPDSGRRNLLQNDTAEEQRETLRRIAEDWARAIKGWSEASVEAPGVICPADHYVDQLYSHGLVSPKSWAYLSFSMKVIDLVTTLGSGRWSDQNRLWGYVLFWALDARKLEKFEQEVMVELRPTSHTDETQSPAADKRREFPLKSLAESCFRALIWDNNQPVLRELVRWLHSAYEPHLDRLLRESQSQGAWLDNVAELVPRLLLRNLVPIHNSVVVRDGSVNVSVAPTAVGPRALFDPGAVSQVSTLYRNLFDGTEVRELEQRSQRMAELFAHTFTLWARLDLNDKLRLSREHLLRLAKDRGRLQALRYLELSYRHRLSVPTYFYRELRAELFTRNPTADERQPVSEVPPALAQAAQDLQQALLDQQEELERTRVEGVDASETVRAIVTGYGELVGLRLSQTVFDSKDAEGLSSQVLEAVRSATESAARLHEERMQELVRRWPQLQQVLSPHGNT